MFHSDSQIPVLPGVLRGHQGLMPTPGQKQSKVFERLKRHSKLRTTYLEVLEQDPLAGPEQGRVLAYLHQQLRLPGLDLRPADAEMQGNGRRRAIGALFVSFLRFHFESGQIKR